MKYTWEPENILDDAAKRVAGESDSCHCYAYALLVLDQAEEIKRLEARIKVLEAEAEAEFAAFLKRLGAKIESINKLTEEIRRIDHVGRPS